MVILVNAQIIPARGTNLDLWEPFQGSKIQLQQSLIASLILRVTTYSVCFSIHQLLTCCDCCFIYLSIDSSGLIYKPI